MCTSPLIRIETIFFVNYCYKITVNHFIKKGSFVIGLSGNNITRLFEEKLEEKDKRNAERKETEMDCENASRD